MLSVPNILSELTPVALLVALGVCLVATIAAYLAYSGIVAKINVNTKSPSFNDLVVAYKTGQGPYKDCGHLFTEAVSILPHKKCIGLYYDDPEAVAPADLRYAVGLILSDDGSDADPAEMETMTGFGFKIKHLPKPNYAVMAEFPFRTTISIYLAIFRVYPKLKEYIASNGLCAYPAAEIYTEDTIQFVMPLSRQEEWFVSEFAEEEVSIATTEHSTNENCKTRSQKNNKQNEQEDEEETEKQEHKVEDEEDKNEEEKATE